ncbi:MAG: cache domain-containing protein, partial [Desulfovibrionaceae bacterium]|nr:cache domain-containing protein [Desulfovibrionaceae bacterium]
MEKYRKMKRVPIRRRLMFLVLLTTIITAISVMAISMTSMIKIKEESEETLTFHLKQNIKSLVEQKAINTNLRLEHYENYIIFITDYIQDMYKNASELIKTGKYIDAPRPSTPKGAFAMSGILAFESMKPKDVYDEIMFFSHLENAWRPIAEENNGLIDTVYLGTKNGFLPSYDKYSYLTAVADQNKYLYYNYYESEWYKKGMKQDALFYTGLYKDSQGRGLTITIGKGFNDANGIRQGVNCADFNLTGLYDEMININFGIGTTSFAFSSDGKLISPDTDELDLNKIGLSKDEISSIIKEKNGI